MQSMPDLVERFIQHFGERGQLWGLNRTVGQIYALIFLSPRALNANDIVERLGMSRSNVSTGLKQLQEWRLVKMSHQQGDRQEYFETPKQIWEVFRTLAQERRRREIEPTLSFLREALTCEVADDQERAAQARMREMHDLIDLFNGWFDDIQKLSPETLERLMRLGSRVSRVLDALAPARRNDP